jgi:hypothetical protein
LRRIRTSLQYGEGKESKNVFEKRFSKHTREKADCQELQKLTSTHNLEASTESREKRKVPFPLLSGRSRHRCAAPKREQIAAMISIIYENNIVTRTPNIANFSLIVKKEGLFGVIFYFFTQGGSLKRLRTSI